MSPSEVIIEVYIMPEDAYWCFFFQLKDFFFYYKGKKMSSSLSVSLPLYNSRPGWTSWPRHAVSARPGDHGGSKRELEGVSLSSKCAICS